MTEPCCDLHITGPAGTCCDEDDCGPCCGACPTCPTLHNAVTAGVAYGRRRDERGSGGIVSAVIVTIVVAALVDVGTGGKVNVVADLALAIHWTAGLLGNILDVLLGSFGATRR